MAMSGLERDGRVDKVRNQEYAKIVGFFFEKGSIFVRPVQCFSLSFVFTDFIKVWKKEKELRRLSKMVSRFTQHRLNFVHLWKLFLVAANS